LDTVPLTSLVVAEVGSLPHFHVIAVETKGELTVSVVAVIKGLVVLAGAQGTKSEYKLFRCLEVGVWLTRDVHALRGV
jgi:hypothetical protein